MAASSLAAVAGWGVKALVPGAARRRVGPPVRAMRHPIDVTRPRLLTASVRVLPDFLVIGAAKAGTSSLFFALKQHPAVIPPTTKELGYFDLHYAHGSCWYRAHFPTIVDRRRTRAAHASFATLDATPAYLFHPHAPRRVAATLPDARLVALLRNPVDRAYSHYWHHRRDGKETLSFEEAIELEEARTAADAARLEIDEWHTSEPLQTYSYLARGRYAEQLERWFDHFPRDRFLVLPSERLSSDADGVLRETLEFVGLPPWQPDAHVRRNAGGYVEPMAPSMRRRLEEYFAPHNDRLVKLLGRELPWS